MYYLQPVVACAPHCTACTVTSQCTSGRCEVGWMDGPNNDCVRAYCLRVTTNYFSQTSFLFVSSKS